MFPIFRNTFQRGISADDIYEPLPEHKSSLLGEKLETIWKEEYKKHESYALHRALFRMFGLNFILIGVLKLVEEILLVVIMPISIGKVVNYFEMDETSIAEKYAYTFASLIVLMLYVNAIVSHPVMMSMLHISMKLRLSCCSLMYRKALRLSKNALERITIGRLITLLSNDVGKFEENFVLAHFAFIAPIQTAVGVFVIYNEIGIYAFFGISFLMSLIPLQVYVGRETSVLRLKIAMRTDERVRMMNEIISGIQTIKMYCWEKPFEKLIATARRDEMKAIRSHAYLIGILYSFETFICRTSIFISIVTFILMGNHITAEKVFIVAAVYNVIRPVITLLFALGVSAIFEVNVSVQRIQEFLSCEEIDMNYQNHLTKDFEGNDMSTTDASSIIPRIKLENVYAKWTTDSEDYNLKNINLYITANELLAIIGPVGSGKSNLINLILQELRIISGEMEIKGKISYASQEPWLFGGSIQQNILFGEKYDRSRYETVIYVCALSSDFDLLPYGDKTYVGERGQSLSGGQKSRINLARCVYRKADIYLLEDPLSAVDVNVGRHLFQECITKFLNNKICILVTHQLQFLRQVDRIIVMNNGTVEQSGTYLELVSNELDFAKMLDAMKEETLEKQSKYQIEESLRQETEEDGIEQPMMDKEYLHEGSVGKKTYWKYFRSGGSIFVMSLLITGIILSNILAFGSDYFVAYWVNLEEDIGNDNGKSISAEKAFIRNNVVYIYTAMTIGTIIFTIGYCLYYMVFFTTASINLHDSIFNKLIYAKLNFFNDNPTGRILSRFSRDLGIIDEYIPVVLLEVIQIALLLLGIFVLSVIVKPFLFIPIMVLMVLSYLFRAVYIKTSRSIKRIEGAARTPIFTHMAVSMNGLTTIRAFSMERRLIEEFDQHQDAHSSAWYIFLASGRCFAFWLDIFCFTFVAVAIFTMIFFSKDLYGGDVGLIITQYIGLIGSLQWGLRQWSELENQMTSVERILEYMNVETEPVRPKLQSLPKDWPDEGRIEFRHLSMRYSSSEEYVLKDLSFVVEPKGKIGIVGRTGAGKSSTISALFQLYELDGKIIIDAFDITNMPLDEARFKISIIPQEPFLFSGTLRRNLDPFEEYDDELIWDALYQVELAEIILDLNHGLNFQLMERGSNLSVGQRQMICLARALIRKNKILVLDEATANVDVATDRLIQETIRKQFSDCTVLTIAHRLNTVMDSDKILVMKDGRMEEFDHPFILLQNKDGLLYKLVRSSGETIATLLEGKARENFELRRTSDED